MNTTLTDKPRAIVEIPVDRDAVESADLIDLTAAAKLIPGRNGGHINVQVLQRYANPREGAAAGPQSARVYVVLPTVLRGCKRFTTAAWVAAWQRKVDDLGAGVGGPPVRERTPRQARKDHERAAGRLRAQGFKVGGAGGTRAKAG